jgi:selenocysteine lyase/cysteine desulfurase
VELFNSIGVEGIRAHKNALSRMLIDSAQQKGIRLVSPVGETQSGTVVLDMDWAAKEKLAAAGVHCDRRKYGLRLSPHIYNTAKEMETVAGLL